MWLEGAFRVLFFTARFLHHILCLRRSVEKRGLASRIHEGYRASLLFDCASDFHFFIDNPSHDSDQNGNHYQVSRMLQFDFAQEDP